MPRSEASREKRRLYSRKHYKENRERHLAQARVRTRKNQKKIREFIAEYKSRQICLHCGEKDPVCLDFHHVGKKDIEIANIYKTGWNMKKIMQEIGNCIVLCANCHRKEHAMINSRVKLVQEERLPWEQEDRGRSTAP